MCMKTKQCCSKQIQFAFTKKKQDPCIGHADATKINLLRKKTFLNGHKHIQTTTRHVFSWHLYVRQLPQFFQTSKERTLLKFFIQHVHFTRLTLTSELSAVSNKLLKKLVFEFDVEKERKKHKRFRTICVGERKQ